MVVWIITLFGEARFFFAPGWWIQDCLWYRYWELGWEARISNSHIIYLIYCIYFLRNIFFPGLCEPGAFTGRTNSTPSTLISNTLDLIFSCSTQLTRLRIRWEHIVGVPLWLSLWQRLWPIGEDKLTGRQPLWLDLCPFYWMLYNICLSCGGVVGVGVRDEGFIRSFPSCTLYYISHNLPRYRPPPLLILHRSPPSSYFFTLINITKIASDISSVSQAF